MTRFVVVMPLLLFIVLLAGAASVASAQSSGCGNGVAVANPANNPGLVADCEALLSARDTLAGTGTLDWSASTPITNWDGVTVGGTPQRVIGLFPSEMGLTGSIPPELGNLTKLIDLSLHRNQLTGTIPSSLGNLTNLEGLYLYDNQLTGTIPPELGGLANLWLLALRDNQLTGCIPAGLRGLPVNDFDRVGLDFCEGKEPAPADPLLERFDTDNSGAIDKNEVLQAINAYLFGGEGVVTKDGRTKPKPRWDVHLSGDDDQLGRAGESLSSVLGECPGSVV